MTFGQRTLNSANEKSCASSRPYLIDLILAAKFPKIPVYRYLSFVHNNFKDDAQCCAQRLLTPA